MNVDLDQEVVLAFLGGEKGSKKALRALLYESYNLPVPARLGAVVETVMPDGKAGRFVRFRTGDDDQEFQWVGCGIGRWFATADIGRVINVLSEGVEPAGDGSLVTYGGTP